MSWQEDLQQRNQAEAARTRARINEANARMAQDVKDRQARQAAQSDADHRSRMRQIAEDGKRMREAREQTYTAPLPTAAAPELPFFTQTEAPPTGSREKGSASNTLLGVALIAIAGLWIFGKLDGNTAFGLSVVSIGIRVAIAVLMNLGTILVVLIKLAAVAFVLYVAFLFFTRH